MYVFLPRLSPSFIFPSSPSIYSDAHLILLSADRNVHGVRDARERAPVHLFVYKYPLTMYAHAMYICKHVHACDARLFFILSENRGNGEETRRIEENIFVEIYVNICIYKNNFIE